MTAVTVLKGGVGRRLAAPPDPITPHSPCQTQQLDSSHSEDSIDLLSGGPVALPHNPLLLNVAAAPPFRAAIRADICSPANQPLKIRLWHSGKERGEVNGAVC